MTYFFMPPEDGAGQLRIPDAKYGMPWEYLLQLVWGHSKNFPMLADRAAPWAHVSPVLVPGADVLDHDPDHPWLAAGLEREHKPLKPQDVLAVAFDGLLRMGMRGALDRGEEVKTMAASLRRLAEALDEFNYTEPAEPFDTEGLRTAAARRAAMPTEEQS